MFNFKDFKKIEESKGSVVMEHPKGHAITVVLKSLPKIQQEQLKRLPIHLKDGGKVKKSKEKLDDKERKNFDDGGETTAPVDTSNMTQDQIDRAPAMEPAQQQVDNPPIPTAPQLNADTNTTPEQPPDPYSQYRAQNEAEYLKSLNNAQKDSQDNINELHQHTQDFDDWMKQNPLNEKHFMESRSTGSKVSNAIGLALGGLSTPFTGQPNPAMDFLNKQIDRDIDAQKTRIGQHKTVYEAWHQLYPDQVIANNLTRATALENLNHKVIMGAADLGTAQAYQRGQQIGVNIQGAKNQLINNAAGQLGGIRNGTIQPQPDPKLTPVPQGQPGTSNQQVPIPGHPLTAEQKAAGYTVDENGGIQSPDASGKSADKHADFWKQVPQDTYEDTHIMPHNSEQLRISAKYNPQSDFAKVDEEYGKARQAEKSLDEVARLFPRLHDHATVLGSVTGAAPEALGTIGGIGGAIIGKGLGAASKIPGGGIAGASAGAYAGEKGGHALGEGVQAMARWASQDVRQWEADKAALTKIVAVALKGTNISSDQIQDVINHNTPGLNDTPATYKEKLDNVRNFIKNNTSTGYLEPVGLTMKKRK